jgi:hypothetical protein
MKKLCVGSLLGPAALLMAGRLPEAAPQLARAYPDIDKAAPARVETATFSLG